MCAPIDKKMHVTKDVVFAEDNLELDLSFIHVPLDKGKPIVQDSLPLTSSIQCPSTAPASPSLSPSESLTPITPPLNLSSTSNTQQPL